LAYLAYGFQVGEIERKERKKISVGVSSCFYLCLEENEKQQTEEEKEKDSDGDEQDQKVDTGPAKKRKRNNGEDSAESVESPSFYLKEYGPDDNNVCYFLAWDKVFVGGGFWDPDYKIKPGVIDSVQSITPQEMKRIEES